MSTSSLLVLASFALLGCGAEHVSVVGSTILNGEVDREDTMVVAVERAGELCTGTLVAARAVLTARHCVAGQLDSSPKGGVVCGQTRFSAAVDAAEVRVSNAPDVKAAAGTWLSVRKVHVPVFDAFCGHDLALLELETPLLAVPSEVRRSGPVAQEIYAAVGYGATDESAKEYGVRRRRDGLSITCVGPKCGMKSVTPKEWLGPEGTCAGDSGGPAFDTAERVVGVVSRSLNGCAAIVYESSESDLAWLDESLAAIASEDPAVTVRAHGGCSIAELGTASEGPGGAAMVLSLATVLRSLSGRRSDQNRPRTCLRSSRRSKSQSAR